jgi:Acetyltransferase (GNAT) domain
VAVRDGEQLVGLAPFYVVPTRFKRVDYRLPGIELAVRLSPLALPGLELDVARLVSQELAGTKPRPDLVALEGHPIDSSWPLALRTGWPGLIRPVLRQYVVHGAPTGSLAGMSYEQWLARKSSNFRSQMGRLRRKFESMGGVARLATYASFEADVTTFIKLHSARWQDRGESGIVAIADRLGPMLRDAARTQLDSGRLRLWVLEVDDEPISAQLFAAAGGEVAYINGGWDERFAQLKPAMLGILLAIEDAFARGDQRIDMGGGEQAYKFRFADGNDPVAWSVMMVPGPRMPITRIRTAPMLTLHAIREGLKQGLSSTQLDRLRSLRKRIRE